MADTHMHFMEKVVGQLKREGWKEQESGSELSDGVLSVSLLKDREVMSIHYDSHPSGAFIGQKWLSEMCY